MNNGKCKLGIDFCKKVNEINYDLSLYEWCKCNNNNEFLQVDLKNNNNVKCSNSCPSD